MWELSTFLQTDFWGIEGHFYVMPLHGIWRCFRFVLPMHCNKRRAAQRFRRLVDYGSGFVEKRNMTTLTTLVRLSRRAVDIIPKANLRGHIFAD